MIAILLGIIEGLTEFLPVSSTGHLILAGHFLNFTGEAAATFEIFIQLGAILAIVLLYFPRFTGFVLPSAKKGFSGVRGLSLLVTTTLPALIFGALFHHFIKAHLFNPQTVVIGLAAGSFWILAVERFCREQKEGAGLDGLTFRQALLIGFFQCLAMWPGVSRAGATILGGMMIGLDRKTATEYSFFAAVPVIAAASLLDLYKSLHIIAPAQIPSFAIGFLVSAVSALLIVKFFIRYVSRNSLNAFAWYRLALAAAVLIFWKG